MQRTAKIERTTKETSIQLDLNLDGSGLADVQTGIGFLDHMLVLLAGHAMIDLALRASGDLHIDYHHTTEDIAIVLGKAIDAALGDRAGIHRMGHAYVPMDESLALVAIDLSGRPYTVIQSAWRGTDIGQLPVSLIEHFLESLAFNARMNLHGRVEYGRDDHHMAEALFKAFARSLAQAVAVDPRRAGAIPSTKGSL